MSAEFRYDDGAPITSTAFGRAFSLCRRRCGIDRGGSVLRLRA